MESDSSVAEMMRLLHTVSGGGLVCRWFSSNLFMGCFATGEKPPSTISPHTWTWTGYRTGWQIELPEWKLFELFVYIYVHFLIVKWGAKEIAHDTLSCIESIKISLLMFIASFNSMWKHFSFFLEHYTKLGCSEKSQIKAKQLCIWFQPCQICIFFSVHSWIPEPL